MEAKAALLIEANCTSERFPAFIRLAEQAPGEKCYLLPDVVSIRDYASCYNSNIMATVTCEAFEVGKVNIGTLQPYLIKMHRHGLSPDIL